MRLLIVLIEFKSSCRSYLCKHRKILLFDLSYLYFPVVCACPPVDTFKNYLDKQHYQEVTMPYSNV